MKLAFCIFKYYPFGGLERNFLRVLEETLSRGHSVTVFTMKWDDDIPDFIKNSSCEIVKVPFSGFSNHARCASYAKNLKPLLEASEFDLITGFNRMPGLDLYYCADVCFTADSRRRRSSLFKLTPRYRIFSAFEKAVFSKEESTHILILSHIQKAIYQQEYATQEERFHPVPAGIDKNKIRACVSEEQRTTYRKDFDIKENEKMLLMIGSDFGRKGVARSITAIASLPEKERSKVKLFVLGKGKAKKMQALAKKLGVENNVFFPGGVNNVPHYLAAADLLLHPAVSENTGNAIVEALIAGVPVLATSNCGYAIHIEQAGAGSVIEGIDFSQDEMNQKFTDLVSLSTKTAATYHQKALDYADKTDFYSRPQAIADIIEDLANMK